MTKEVIDFTDYKYTRIAKEFVHIRAKDPSRAAQFARKAVSSKDFLILSKYIEKELQQIGAYEPHEGQD